MCDIAVAIACDCVMIDATKGKHYGSKQTQTRLRRLYLGALAECFWCWCGLCGLYENANGLRKQTVPTDKQIREQAELLVRNEVYCSLTYIVDSLAKSYGESFKTNEALGELVEQVAELYAPRIVSTDEGEEYDYEEVFEAWSVSGWLADQLEERGERIVRDFGNHNVWGRTTTGQAIAIDYVIEQIAASVLSRK